MSFREFLAGLRSVVGATRTLLEVPEGLRGIQEGFLEVSVNFQRVSETLKVVSRGLRAFGGGGFLVGLRVTTWISGGFRDVQKSLQESLKKSSR